MLTYRLPKTRNAVGTAMLQFVERGTFVEWINEDNELERGKITNLLNGNKIAVIQLEDGTVWRARRISLAKYAPNIIFYNIPGQHKLPKESVLMQKAAEKDQGLLEQASIAPIQTQKKESPQPKRKEPKRPTTEESESFSAMGAFISRVVKDTELFLLVSSDEV